jgi:hypothetical protein
MPWYIEKSMQCFNHTPSHCRQDSPHAWIRPKYGHNHQLTEPPEDSTLLDPPPPAITKLQEITGTLLFYSRAVNPNMLVALGTIASAQSKGTEATTQAITQLINYAATHLDATIRYISSDMHFHI